MSTKLPPQTGQAGSEDDVGSFWDGRSPESFCIASVSPFQMRVDYIVPDRQTAEKTSQNGRKNRRSSDQSVIAKATRANASAKSRSNASLKSIAVCLGSFAKT